MNNNRGNETQDNVINVYFGVDEKHTPNQIINNSPTAVNEGVVGNSSDFETADRNRLAGKLAGLLGNASEEPVVVDQPILKVLDQRSVEEICKETVGTSDDKLLDIDIGMGASLRRLSLEQARKEQL